MPEVFDRLFVPDPHKEERIRPSVREKILSQPQMIMVNTRDVAALRTQWGCCLKNKPLRGRELVRGEKVILALGETEESREAYVVETEKGLSYGNQSTITITVAFDVGVLLGSDRTGNISCGGLSI